MDRVVFSVVVPVYGNEGSVGALVERLAGLNETLHGRLEAVIVIDGSPDQSGPLLQKQLSEAPFESQLLWHSRNFGSFAAIRTGLEAAKGDYVAVMAADLQEPAELVLDFFDVLAQGPFDVAVGVRAGREDPSASKFMANAYWKTYRRLVQPEIPPGGVDIFACTRQVADVLVQFSESHSSLVGLLFWAGFRRADVSYERLERADGGRSAWSLSKKVAYMMDSMYSFTDKPISAMKLVGMLGVSASVLVSVLVLMNWALGWITVPGYTPLMLSVMFLSSMIMLSLGIVGSYVWRTYENSKQRPHALVMWREEFDGC